jgi:hypothetical protein
VLTNSLHLPFLSEVTNDLEGHTYVCYSEHKETRQDSNRAREWDSKILHMRNSLKAVVGRRELARPDDAVVGRRELA